MIPHLFYSVIISSLFVDLLERRFPDQFRSILTDGTYNAVYYYSKAQIYFTNLSNKLNNFIEDYPILSKIKNELNFIVKHKLITFKLTLTEFFKNGDFCPEDTSNFDLAIYSWLEDECVNKMTIYKAVNNITITEPSDIKFILVELKIGENKTYKIDLKTEKYNFYLIGNKFTKQFFIYYLKQWLKIKESINDDDKIILKIIDHNVNTVEIEFTDKNESILLEKSGYKVINSE
jgi:hypothetical protein